MQNRQLQSWLSTDEYEQIAAEWETQSILEEELKDKPSELQRYEDKLKEANMMHNRSDALHELRNSKGFQQMEVSKAN